MMMHKANMINLASKGLVSRGTFTFTRLNSSKISKSNADSTNANQFLKPTTRLLNEKLKKEQELKKERNKLAVSSLKDIFSVFSPSGGDDEELDMSNFDPKPIYADPPSFLSLPYHKQQFMIEDLEEKLKRKWKSVNIDVKRFSYWISYGSHGPREGFPDFLDYVHLNRQGSATESQSKATDEMNHFIGKVEGSKVEKKNTKSEKEYIPIDLPFKLPSVIKSTKPNKHTKVKNLKPLDPRFFGKLRQQQNASDKRMNPYNKIIVLAVVILSLINWRRDRDVNRTGNTPSYDFESIDVDRMLAKEEELKEIHENCKETLDKDQDLCLKQNSANKERKRRWYFLWLY